MLPSQESAFNLKQGGDLMASRLYKNRILLGGPSAGYAMRQRRLAQSDFSLGLLKIFVLTIALLVLLPRLSFGQAINAQVTGTVVDSSGAVIPGANVALTNTLTQQVRSFVSDSSGGFVFPDVVPGTYSLRITKDGFETYNQTGIAISSGETLALHEIPLAVGNVTTEISVVANGARVETDTSARTGLVTTSQISEIPNKGRNFLDYLNVLPGTAGSATGTDAPAWSAAPPVFNGGDSGTTVIQIDGVTSQDLNLRSSLIQPSVDAIQEMRVQTGNQNAEFGARGGGTINVTIKSGTRDFHGTAYEFNRNDAYNANDYFRKLNSNPSIAMHPAPYKYNDFGGTIGGPVILPGTNFNKSRTRAFFFFSDDNLHRTIAGNPSAVTMPTPNERNGIFTNLVGNLKVPGAVCTGTAPNITCNVQGAQNTAGARLLSLFPQPQCLRPAVDTAANSYNGLSSTLPACGAATSNFSFVSVSPYPWSDIILRNDFNLNAKNTMFVRLLRNYEDQEGSPLLGGTMVGRSLLLTGN